MFYRLFAIFTGNPLDDFLRRFISIQLIGASILIRIECTMIFIQSNLTIMESQGAHFFSIIGSFHYSVKLRGKISYYFTRFLLKNREKLRK